MDLTVLAPTWLKAFASSVPDTLPKVPVGVVAQTLAAAETQVKGVYDYLLGANMQALGSVLKGEPLSGDQGRRVFLVGLTLGAAIGAGGQYAISKYRASRSATEVTDLKDLS